MNHKALKDTWTQQQPTTPDTSWVMRTWKRRQRMFHLNLLGEILGSVFAGGMGLWFALNNSTITLWVMLAIICAVLLANAIIFTRSVLARQGKGLEKVSNHLEHLLHMAKTDLRTTIHLRTLTIVSGFAMMSWAIWHIITHLDIYIQRPIGGVIGIGGIVAILAAILVAGHFKRQKLEDEIARLKHWIGGYMPEDVASAQ